MRKQVKQLNIQSLFEACTLLALAVWLFVYLVSERYLIYVTPRMLPYLIGTIVVLALLAGVTLTRLFRPNRRARFAHVFMLALPLILLLLPHGTINVDSGSFSSIGVASSTQEAAAPMPTEAQESTGVSLEEERISANESSATDEIPGLDRENRIITISTDNYYTWMTRFYDVPASYEGYTVRMTGYVINGSDVFASDEFAIARLVMTCCVADLVPVGIICRYADASQLKADEWFSVEGALILGSYESNGTIYSEPQLEVTRIEPAEEIRGYVYPY